LLEETEATVLDAVVETHQAQFVGERLARVEAAKASEVIAAQPGVGSDGLGNVAYEAQAFGSPDDKVSTGLMEGMKAAEVEVGVFCICPQKGAIQDFPYPF
jgi:hypothetical protein